MRIEKTCTLPVSRKEAYDYLHDPKTWPMWLAGMVEVLDVEHASWDAPGDEVRFIYRVVGRKVEGVLHLDEIQPGELIKAHATMPGVGDFYQEWRYRDAEGDTCTLTVVYETEPPASLFGTVIDRTVTSRAIDHDLTLSLANAEGVFTIGVPE